MKNILYSCGCNSAKVIQVIQITSVYGDGTKTQPSRIVTEFWSLDGKKLAESDSLVDGKQVDEQS